MSLPAAADRPRAYISPPATDYGYEWNRRLPHCMDYDFHTVRRIASLVACVLSYSLGGDGARAEEPVVLAKLAATHAEASRRSTENGDFRSMTGASASPSTEPAGAAADLWPLTITDAHTQRTAVVRLYDASGQVDELAAAELDELLGDARHPAKIRTTTLDRRTLQLIFRAAYHFGAHEVEVISAYRKPGRRPEGRHGEGRAIDFRLAKISCNALAVYLRKLPRVGVGLYTHPGTRFVHLDVRERSYHWLDASPPGASWPLRSIGGAELAGRDASYSSHDDLPEAMAPADLRAADLGAQIQLGSTRISTPRSVQ